MNFSWLKFNWDTNEMAPTGFETHTDNLVGALNYSIDSMYPKILNAMSVRAIAALGLSFLIKKKMLPFFSIPKKSLIVPKRWQHNHWALITFQFEPLPRDEDKIKSKYLLSFYNKINW